MSVENIKAFSIVGKKDFLDEVVLTLGKSKIFHPDEVSSFYSNTRDFTKITGNNPYSEPVSRITAVMQALGIEDKYVKTKKSFNPDFDEINAYSKTVSEEVDALMKEKASVRQKYHECKRRIEEVSHFIDLDRNIEDLLAMEYVKAVFGRIPKENAAKLNSSDSSYDFIEFVPCSEEGSYIWGVYFVPKNQHEKTERILSRMYFEESAFASMDKAPSERYEDLQKDCKELEAACAQIEKKINIYKEENSDKILMYYTRAAEFNLYHSIKAKAMERNYIFCIVGWVPQKEAKKLEAELNEIESVEVTVSNASDEPKLSPPVKLKHTFLTRPFEFYTEMYGVPKYNEIDPTTFVAITYVLLFGIMFGDVGHGILITIAGLLMWFIKKMPIGKILVPCGISGMVFGAVYGSVFGFENALDWLYRDLFGLSEKPIEVMSPRFTNLILYAAVGIGMLLLCIAMILNIYTSFRQKKYGRMLFDTNGIAGFVFYGMICAGIVALMMWNVNLFTLPYILIIVLMFVLIFLREPLGALVDGERDKLPDKWGGFIAENFFESFEVLLSYVTNTMSFLRVAAFVLVHAGMMQVVFTLAQTSGPGYWAVVIFGNLLVAALECLLVCIQVLRLEFYEMFSRFYSGEGRPYEPVRLKLTKN